MTASETRLSRALAWVDNAYRELSKDESFIERPQQRDLSISVATAMVEGNPLAMEAPTGTGKTVAYLIGALAVNKTAEDAMKEPVVISTATKALQQQLVTNDLPKLVRAGLLFDKEVGIAKGKGNYLCLKQAEETEALLVRGNAEPELFVDSARSSMDPDQVGAMSQAFRDSYWDGDFDNYEGARPKSVFPIAVSSDTCVRKKCSYYGECAYYRARARLAGCSVLVVNHDLLLLDLKLVAEGLEPTLPVANYFIVIDEAHHLPEKAIKVGSSDAALTQLQQALPKLAGVQRLLERNPSLAALASTVNVKSADLERTPVGNSLRELVDLLAVVPVDADSCQYRFRRGEVPNNISDAIKRTAASVRDLNKSVSALVTIVREKSSSLGPALAERANEVLRRALDVKSLCDECLKTFDAFGSPGGRVVKWLFRKEGAVSLHSAPLEGADVLGPLLWSSDRVRAVAMVSATLRDVRGFTRFRARAGLPAKATTGALPYTFPYEKSVLRVAAMAATPKMAERHQFLVELGAKLPNYIDPNDATLLLFPSWSMLREFAPRLKARFGESRVRVQGEQGIKQLVREHCEAVERNEGSVLMGVATLAEGLDLPGRLVTHVCIITLPFAVPTDPVEQELSDLLGNRYFGERSLPDAMVRLTQMVGRLLRRETDEGTVTVFDRRLASTSYGRQMLNELPPFTKVIEPMTR